MAEAPLIWIVEDDALTQRIVSELLKKAGFIPVAFESAEKALAVLRGCLHNGKYAGLPSLILLDMLLPGMSGVDLIRLLKQEEAWAKIPVVVMSVLSRQDNLVSESEAAGAFWVNKPVDADHLIETVQEILASAGMRGNSLHG